jgi:hypothetical protein
MTGWLWNSAVPGMAVPGMATPGKDGTVGGAGPFEYIGHIPVYYLDYLDIFTQKTLCAVPGGWYSMFPANSRAGLTTPPPDHSWDPPDQFSFRLILHQHEVLATARAHSAAMHAAAAARPVAPQPQGSPSYAPPPEPPPPSEAALTLAAARAQNAKLQARRARGEPVGC